MVRTVIHPALDRMLLGYAAAVPVAAYTSALALGVFGFLAQVKTGSPPGDTIAALFVATAIVGSVALPVALLAGLPALAIAFWLVAIRGVRSKWLFPLNGMLGSAVAALIFLPVFHPTGRLSRDLTDAEVLAAAMIGLTILAPAGALAGWVFWRIGIRRSPKLARDLK